MAWYWWVLVVYLSVAVPLIVRVSYTSYQDYRGRDAAWIQDMLKSGITLDELNIGWGPWLAGVLGIIGWPLILGWVVTMFIWQIPDDIRFFLVDEHNLRPEHK